MRAPARCLAILILAVPPLLGLPRDSGGEEVQRPSDAEIRRLSPAAFPELPPAVARDLSRRGCRIPQTYVDEKPHNAVRGSFRKPGQIDWAVLCSSEGVSSLLVYWNGSSEGVTDLGGSRDESWLQGIGEGRVGFSRYIAPVDKDYIPEHYERYGGPKPPPLDHDGINHAFAEKASVVLYWHEGKWLELSGAD